MISLCITTYNRTELLFECFEQVLSDDRISEIVIVDDCSAPEIYNTIVWKYNGIDKVKVYRNEVNLDCYRNKKRAVELASNEWVILFDSDNVITKEYVDCLYSIEQDWINPKGIIYQPSFAEPNFDFSRYAGKVISGGNVLQFMSDPTFQTMLNAMNYFVNRDEYLRVWDGSVDPVTSDSLFQNYNWLNTGNSIFVVPNLHYYHRVDNHNGEEKSHYASNHRRTPRGFHESIIEKIKELK